MNAYETWAGTVTPRPWKLTPFGTDEIVICFETRPRLWRRFWYRVFFGWRWEWIDE